MSTFIQVLFFSLVGSVFSLAGGILLLKNQKFANSFAHYGAPFAAGTLLAAAFLDLLQESGPTGSKFALVGIILFFLVERFLSWFHHHHPHKKGEHRDPKVSMVIFGDTLHNFIDGLAIGAAFIVSPQAGIITSLAVAAHEIPQEIGDFGLMLSKGLSRKRVFLVNLISAFAAVIAAVLIFLYGRNLTINTDPLLGLIAGMFIYVAVSDIIPEIHQKTSRRAANISAILLVSGALFVAVTSNLVHSYLETQHNETESHIEQKSNH